MIFRPIKALLLAAILSGCAQGPEGGKAEIAGKPLIEQVIALQVDAMPDGAIIRATGLPPTQGYWQAELVEVDTANAATLTYEFHILPPPDDHPIGTQRSREVIVGRAVSEQRLRRAQRIVVIAQTNSRAVRR